MPRPKPVEPIKKTSIRLTERHILIFKQLGGSEWLRGMLDKKAPFPKKYYDSRLNSSTGETNALRKQTTPIQERIRATEGTWGAPQTNGAAEG